MFIVLANSRKWERGFIASQLRSMGHNVLETPDSGEVPESFPPEFECVDMVVTCEKSLDLILRMKNMWGVYTLATVPREYIDGLGSALERSFIDDFLVSPVEACELRLRVMTARNLLSSRTALEEKLIALKVMIKSQTKAMRRQAGATRRTQDEIFLRLYNALEARDMETASHVYRIGNASACIGELLGWEDSRVDAVRCAAPLHDIGKIGISDAILSKPGPLTGEEFEVIKQHTVKGARILSGSKNKVIRMGEVLALSHHENWDGSGYPYGLKGEKIPLEARVVAVADVYDALLADRVYRKRLGKTQALDIIGNEAGKKFDPAVVDVFMKNISAIHIHFNGLAMADSPKEEA